MSHPLLSPNDYPNFLEAVERFFTDNSSILSCDVTHLLDQTDMRDLEARVKEYYGSTNSVSENMAKVAGTFGAKDDSYAYVKALGSIFAGAIKQGYDHRPVMRYLHKFTISKPVLNMEEETGTLFRAFAEMVVDRQLSLNDWRHWYALATWDSGSCNLEPHAGLVNKRGINEVREILYKHLDQNSPKLGMASANFQAKVARYSKRRAVTLRPASAMIADVRAERWMKGADLAGSRTYMTQAKDPSLLLGYLKDTKQEVFFSGHESLITIGGPGSGKTASQVIPNLLRYRGSAVVLDVKGDLWAKTAAYRQKTFGHRVLRFAPGDLTGKTNRYNVFDLIPDASNPGEAAHYCSILAQQLVPDNPHAKEKFWDNSAREIIWSCAMMVALKNTGDYRSMAGLARLVNFPLSDDPNSKSRLMAASMERNGERHNLQQLSSNAEMWVPQNNKFTATTNSMFATAKASLSTYARTPTVIKALSASDWSPVTLRKQPTTVYFCMSADDLRTYGAIIRIILLQHANVLQDYNASPDEPPITFFIDELPKLGNFASILDLQEIGRSAGLRLWMFCQNIPQLMTAFGGDSYLGVIDSCKVRCFMQPDNATADYLSPSLSGINKFGKSTEAVTEAELMGPDYKDKIIVTSSNEKPVVLDKHYSYLREPEKMMPPPPVT